MTRLANLQLIASVGLLAAVSNPVLHSNYNSEDPGPPPATTSHPADDDGDDWSTSGFTKLFPTASANIFIARPWKRRTDHGGSVFASVKAVR